MQENIEINELLPVPDIDRPRGPDRVSENVILRNQRNQVTLLGFSKWCQA